MQANAARSHKRIRPWTQTGGIKPMPKRKEPELTPEEQFKRFVKTAREREVDESGKEFEKTFDKIMNPKTQTKTKPKK